MASVNFVTCHDGFTFEISCPTTRRQRGQLEGNADGESHNRSWNQGPKARRKTLR